MSTPATSGEATTPSKTQLTDNQIDQFYGSDEMKKRHQRNIWIIGVDSIDSSEMVKAQIISGRRDIILISESEIIEIGRRMFASRYSIGIHATVSFATWIRNATVAQRFIQEAHVHLRTFVNGAIRATEKLVELYPSERESTYSVEFKSHAHLIFGYAAVLMNLCDYRV